MKKHYEVEYTPENSAIRVGEKDMSEKEANAFQPYISSILRALYIGLIWSCRLLECTLCDTMTKMLGRSRREILLKPGCD